MYCNLYLQLCFIYTYIYLLLFKEIKMIMHNMLHPDSQTMIKLH